MKVSEPAVAYNTSNLQSIKNQLIASIDASTDVDKLERCLEFLQLPESDAPCIFTDEEFEEELRLSEESGFISHEEALKEFAKWGFER